MKQIIYDNGDFKLEIEFDGELFRLIETQLDNYQEEITFNLEDSNKITDFFNKIKEESNKKYVQNK